MKPLIIIALTLASVGCFSQDEKPCVSGSALVHVFREKAFTASAISRSVWVDSTELAKISNGSYFQACLPAGTHHFRVDDNPHGNLELELAPSVDYFLQVQLPIAMWKAHWEIIRTDEPLAASIMATCFPLKSDKIKARDYVVAHTFIRRTPVMAASFVQPASTSAPSQLYDIKGDRLGMSLDDFKKKYYSFHPGYPKQHIPDGIGPHCVQQQDPTMILSADEAGAGVIACYPGNDLVKEIILHRDPAPTISNVPLSAYSFHFYKGQLFKVIAIFPSDGYDSMKAAFAEKFGTPSITPHELQNSYGAKFDGEESNWSNGVSSIEMKRRTHDLETAAMIMLLPDVQKQVEAAMPKKAKDL